MSAQGTIVERSPDPNWPDSSPQGGAVTFVAIAEQRNITPPALSRKEIEMTTHSEADDAYVVGIRRHGTMQMDLNFVPFDTSQDHTTGLQHAWFTGSRDIYRITYPDGTKWLFSGFVSNFAPAAPVDDRLSAAVSIRPTGRHQWQTSGGVFTPSS
jgi:hypothetical protein